MTVDPSVTLGRAGLVWDGEEHLVFGAEAHYWRIDTDRWEAVLDTTVELGFTMISTYVPWSVHEVAPGEHDFNGQLDIVRFLRMAGDRGLKAIVRIGPDTATEQPDSGWPPRVLADPSCQARRPTGEPYLLVTATGHCFPPSYASSKFLRETRGWYEAVVPLLAPLQHPAGPIVACQVDNELGYHFQSNSFAMDHHPEFVAGWRSFVQAKRGSEPYGTGPVDQVAPPVDGTDSPVERRIDWIEYREHHRVEVLARFAEWARELGMASVPIQHNDYPRTTTPMDAGRLEQLGAVDWAAIDVYTTAPGGRFVRDIARTAAGSTRLPFLAELGAGWLTLPWLLPMATTAADEEVIALRALFSGFRAVNVYQLVERDRWYGSPVDRDGMPRPVKASLYPRLRAMLDGIGWLELERQVRVLVLENRDEARRSAALDTLAEVVPCFAQLLPVDLRLTRLADPDGDAIARWEGDLAAALDVTGVDVDRAATSSLPALDRYDVVFIPFVSALDPSVVEALRSCRATVYAGPADPTLDSVAHLPNPAAAALPAPAFQVSSASVDVHVWSGAGRTIVAVFESGGAPQTVTLAFDGRRRFEGRWTPSTLEGEGTVEFDLGAYGAQVWEVFER